MTDRTFKSAEQVHDASGRQYHIGCGPGDVAERILLVGDPARAQLVAEQFESIDVERRNREFVTFTGKHRGLPVSVVGTGIGPDNMEIAVIELSQCVDSPIMIRAGTCGSLQERVVLGDLVVTTGAHRLENTSLHFVDANYPAVAHPQVVMALLEAAASTDRSVHMGITATAPGFYGAQSRSVPGFAPRDPSLVDQLAAYGVLNLEMEISCLLTLASVRGFRAGAVCVVFAERSANIFINADDKQAAETELRSNGLGSVSRARRLRPTPRPAPALASWTRAGMKL